MELTSAELSTIRELEQLKYAYARCLDQKRWDELGELFTEDAHASYGGGAYVFDGREAIMGFLVRNMDRPGFLSSHRMHHPEITLISDTEATGRWALDDHNIDTDFQIEVQGAAFYEDTYVKVDGRWLIATTGYRRSFETLTPLGETKVTAAWWGTDGKSILPAV